MCKLQKFVTFTRILPDSQKNTLSYLCSYFKTEPYKKPSSEHFLESTWKKRHGNLCNLRGILKFNVLRVEGSIAMKEKLHDMMTKPIIGDEDSSNDSLENDRLPFDF